MKNIILILLTIPVFGISQTYNFQLDNGSLSWQAIYSKPISPDQVADQLVRNSYFEQVTKTDDEAIFRFKGMPMDHRGAGSSDMTTSMYISNSVWSGLAIVQFKDGRYRVTIKDIMSDLAAMSLDGTLQSKDPLESWALRKKNTEFRNGFLRNDAPIFNHTFNQYFDFKNDVASDDDW